VRGLAVDVQVLCNKIGGGFNRRGALAECLPAMVEHLNDGADADGDQKRDDEAGNGAAEQGLGIEEASVGRLGNGLRQALDGIRVCRRTRHTGARHRRPPFFR